MANNQNLGFDHRFAVGPAGSTLEFTVDILSSTVKVMSEVLDATGLTGVRDHRSDRTRRGIQRVGGQLTIAASPRALDWFMPYILGGSESTDVYSVADTLPGFDLWDDVLGDGTYISEFGELYVNRFSLALRGGGAGSGILTFTLDVIGKTFDKDIAAGNTWSTGANWKGGTEVALKSTAGFDDPYTFWDSTITLFGGSVAIDEGELVIDNALDVRFRNSRTAVSIRPTDRTVSFSSNVPLDSTALANYFIDKAAADATLVLYNGSPGVTTTFALNDLAVADEGPDVRGRGDVPLILRGNARANSTTDSVQATLAETSGDLWTNTTATYH